MVSLPTFRLFSGAERPDFARWLNRHHGRFGTMRAPWTPKNTHVFIPLALTIRSRLPSSERDDQFHVCREATVVDVDTFEESRDLGGVVGEHCW